MSEASGHAELPPDLKEKCTTIIDGILVATDIDTITTKKIMAGVQKVMKQDLAPYKYSLKALILQRFDIVASFNEPNNETSDDHKPPITTNGDTDGGHVTTNGKRPMSSESFSTAASPPPVKKQKTSKTTKTTPRGAQDADAVLAARLQAEENGRARSTRGGGTNKRKAPVKREKPKKKKSKTKITSDDDSEAASGAEREVNRTGGFHKPMSLSPPLAQLLGETQLSRPQTVKRIWAYIKENNLQKPDDKRQILCDDALRSVFKQDTVHMFTMNKILSQNLYAIDEIVE
ncbi:SWIB-domain-containing protein [Microthyrium microscopicum]|uniref:SWIB-domain-containing protein n=1 Tax=Microthyrium microscopicum TaxID=703497 RepID=A0A6A6UF77_9PEZI|nr:SWIB-domain-containing protein [Microthyrium microscopicum]